MLDFLSRPVIAISNLTDALVNLIPKDNEELVPWPASNKPTTSPLFFELNVDAEGSRKWFQKNWTISLYISAAYVLLIYFGQKWMKTRPAYNLRLPLAVWNIFLALFSVTSLIRITPEWIEIFQSKNGLHKTACVRDPYNPVSAYYALLFAVSKLVELGDTVFIVLRKTPLIFLHWYHHMATMIVCFMTYAQAEPVSRFVGFMNLIAHSFMYTWYAAKAMKFNPPKKIAMAITLIQLSQMAFGVLISSYILFAKTMGVECASSIRGANIQLFIYASYFVLFLNYFIQAYFSNKEKSKKA